MAQATAQVTIDHENIRRWADERGGRPAVVKDTVRDENAIGVLRINFPGYSGEDTLEEMNWEEFFDKFERANLAFLYQDRTADGKLSRFFKFVRRDHVHDTSSEERD